MMLDIDFFKNVNGKHGRPSGDVVLREIGELWQKRLDRTDVMGRYGGEGFLVALPNTGIEGTFVIASDIRRLVSDCHFSTEDNYFHITISIGLAELDHKKHQTLDKLIAEADNALYEAKNTGRNRVVAYSAGEGGAVALPDTYK